MLTTRRAGASLGLVAVTATLLLAGLLCLAHGVDDGHGHSQSHGHDRGPASPDFCTGLAVVDSAILLVRAGTVGWLDRDPLAGPASAPLRVLDPPPRSAAQA